MMPALIFRLHKESEYLKEILIKGPKLSTEQNFKNYKICILFPSLTN